VTVVLKQDPLLPDQWHIQNTGQDAFASTLPVQGNDMNVAGAWTTGFSGKGIKVGVVDTGLEAAHEDLQANVDLNSSHNFLTGTHDPSPSGTGFDHGTSVSGIIGAVAFNDKGGRGIAYNATLRGYNLIAPGAFSVANMAQALGGSTVSVDNDLFNASFGPVANAIPQFRTTEFVVVYVNIASTPGLPCNQIELTSPAGTKSILLHAANGFTNAAVVNSRFESNAFYGEPVNGTWTLRFLDLCTAQVTSTSLSTSQPQTLLLSGY
jgi:subtilisin family serine protease